MKIVKQTVFFSVGILAVLALMGCFNSAMTISPGETGGVDTIRKGGSIKETWE